MFANLCSNSLKFTPRGTGLGLAICREVLRAHAGAIRAKAGAPRSSA